MPDILDRMSAQAERPELDDDTGQQLSDCNPPLPCLLAVFAEGDPVSASFDDEAQGNDGSGAGAQHHHPL
jgi:hypothetical protein